MIFAALSVGIAVAFLMMAAHITEQKHAETQMVASQTRRFRSPAGMSHFIDGPADQRMSLNLITDGWSRYAAQITMFREAKHWLKAAGIPLSPVGFAMALVGGSAFSIILFLTMGLSTGIAVGGGAAALLLPILHVHRIRQNYVIKFSEQLPGAVGAIANALDIGQSVEASLSHVARQSPHPMSDELMILHNELLFGSSLAEVMAHMANRIGSPEARFLCTCLAVQQKTGGNLSEVLKNLETTIRDQFSIRRDARAITAEGRMSIVVLSILPWLLFAFQYLRSREVTETFMHSSGGRMAILTAVALEAAGFYWGSRIMNLEKM